MHTFNSHKALSVCDAIIHEAGFTPPQPTIHNFTRYTEFVVNLIKEWPKKRREAEEWWLRDFLEYLIYLNDCFDSEVKRDPAILYKPQHKIAQEFHSSLATWRAIFGGNRTAKTQTGCIETYRIVTGQHPFRTFKDGPSACVVLTPLPLKDYKPKVFLKKFIEGEENNILSPLFPEGGRWFHHWNKQLNILTLACPSCAKELKASSCPSHHAKSQIYLISAEQDIKVLESFTARAIHIDELRGLEEDYYIAARQRIATIPNSFGYVTATPIGMTQESWAWQHFIEPADGPPEENRANPLDEDSPPSVQYWKINQYEAGLIPHDRIEEDARGMDEFEAASRIKGEFAPLARNPVFDRIRLAEISRSDCKDPRYLNLEIELDPQYRYEQQFGGPDIELLQFAHELKSVEVYPSKPDEWTGLRVWESPDPKGHYILAIDSARGLMYQKSVGAKTRFGDASCATVLKLTHKENRVQLEEVAKFYGWLSVFDYGDALKKVGIYYNYALAIVETTGGIGSSVMDYLRKKLFYPNLFRDQSRPEQFQFGLDSQLGVDTNQYSKPRMIGALQDAIKGGWLTVRDRAFITEAVAFEQETSSSGKSTIYRGSGGVRDDRVMSMALGCYAVVTSPVESLMVGGEFGVNLADRAIEQYNEQLNEEYPDV